MQKKEQFKNEILLKMKYHLGKNELAILEEALSESLYQVEIVDAITLPATVTDSNEPLFTHIVGDKSKVLGKGGIFKEIKNIAKRCGINKRVYPQLFRSTTATNIVRRGGTADDSGCYLGHKGSDVTRRHYIAEKNPRIVFFRFVYSM